jgi:dipeptidyl aminopeptidase/acylaminoacyl peptidase
MIDAGITWAGVLAWDDIRSVDYLVTRPEVDPKRIACTGLSVGGFRTNFLAGLDPRIKAACVAGWDFVSLPAAALRVLYCARGMAARSA